MHMLRVKSLTWLQANDVIIDDSRMHKFPCFRSRVLTTGDESSSGLCR
jgi:hypothetical protein